MTTPPEGNDMIGQRKKRVPTKREPLPHLWIFHNDHGGGGAVYFFLPKGSDIDTGNHGLKEIFNRDILSIEGVRNFCLSATFIGVEWYATPGNLTVIDTAYEAIVSKGLAILSRYFDWQGELNVQGFETLEEMQAFRQRMRWQRWFFGYQIE